MIPPKGSTAYTEIPLKKRDHHTHPRVSNHFKLQGYNQRSINWSVKKTNPNYIVYPPKNLTYSPTSRHFWFDEEFQTFRKRWDTPRKFNSSPLKIDKIIIFQAFSMLNFGGVCDGSLGGYHMFFPSNRKFTSRPQGTPDLAHPHPSGNLWLEPGARCCPGCKIYQLKNTRQVVSCVFCVCKYSLLKYMLLYNHNIVIY